MTSLPSTLTAKKSMKMTFSSDKIYYNFLRRIQRLQIFKIPIDVIRTLKCMCIEKFSCKKTLLFERTLEIIYTNSLQLFHILLRS